MYIIYYKLSYRNLITLYWLISNKKMKMKKKLNFLNFILKNLKIKIYILKNNEIHY